MEPLADLEVLEDPTAAVVALGPIHARHLSEPAEPGSAASLAIRVGLARQKVNYHLRVLEAHGVVRPVDQLRWGGTGRATRGRHRSLLRRLSDRDLVAHSSPRESRS